MGVAHSDWILQNNLFQTFFSDLCGVSGLILQQRDKLLWFSSGHGTRRCSMLFNNAMYQALVSAKYRSFSTLKASVSDRLVKTGIGASLVSSV